MIMYGETMLVPALRALIREFNVSYSTSSWILSTTYLMPAAVMIPLAGKKLSDIYGGKKVLLVMMAIYTVGIGLAAFVDSISWLFISRAIHAVGIAMFVIPFSRIICDQFPRDKISIGQSIISSIFASGRVIGLLIGERIISNFGLRTTFLSTVPIAIALFIIIWRFNYDVKKLDVKKISKTKSYIRNHSIRGSALTFFIHVVLYIL
jgi:MFS family permease